MKKIFTSLFFVAAFALAGAQSYWHPAGTQVSKLRPEVSVSKFYTLDVPALKKQLASASLVGSGGAAVEITLPTLSGKEERFAVYSSPVAEMSLVEKYGLGSYVGIGMDDKRKIVRFSLTGNDFQALIIKDEKYEFIEPQNTEKTVFGIFPKTIEGGAHGFVCTMNEGALSKKEIDELAAYGKDYADSSTGKISDRKYRTMRLALSVTGEYTKFFGGVPQALAQMNATMTRVNGVFEKEFALHLNIIDKPEIVFPDPATDPYSPSTSMSKWNLELQKTLTAMVGEANYDIGHLFGASGGGGNAGCIGCVCISPTLDSNGAATTNGKGSGITSPADEKPFGDTFDIDYVAHEMGHQLGANHTFAHSLENAGVNMEPGSGSTIMGYAGITGADNVQSNSDPYFHTINISQVQTNLISKTCDVETAITNSAPVVAAMADVTIPKGTAFVLKGSATDPDNDALEYNWEQVDNATVTISKTNIGLTTSGASFRSKLGESTPERYFPMFSSVMNEGLRIPNKWESVPMVARTMNFRMTVRDYNVNKPQTSFATQKVIVGADGPFQITTTKIYTNMTPPMITWDVANTTAAPYNVANVKIDYTTDNGITWTTLSESTPNDGSEGFAQLSTMQGNAKFRVTSIGNVFYAVNPSPVTFAVAADCNGAAPTNVLASNLTINSIKVDWDFIVNATYIVRYRKTGTTAWTELTGTNTTLTITGLEDSTTYEIQVAAVCSGTVGTYSTSISASTLGQPYCPMAGGSASDEYISNVTVNYMVSNSGASGYTDFTTNPARVPVLTAGSTGNTISVTKAWAGSKFNEAVAVWIDFNRNGTFETSEKIFATAADQTTPVNGTFSVPADAYAGDKTTRMRVAMRYSAAPVGPCNNFSYGEVEDYAVKILPVGVLGTNEALAAKGIKLYPNPADDVVNISNLSSTATYTVYSADGRLALSGKMADGKVNVSRLTKGFYMITVKDKSESFTLKFIKK